MWWRRLLLAIALILATVGGAGFLNSLRNTVPVVLVKEAVSAHTVLTAEMLTVRHVNREALEAIAPRAIQRIEDAVGLVTRVNLAAGEVVQRDPRRLNVLPEGADMTKARYWVPDDMRLVGVRVDIPGAVTGWVAPGDRVDVIYTARGTGQNASARTILQGVEVFSVGSQVKGASSGPMPAAASSSIDVSLLVTPEQAQALALAKRSGGAIDLSLTPPNPRPHDLPPAGGS